MTVYRPSSEDRAIEAAGGYFMLTEAQALEPESCVDELRRRRRRALSLMRMEPKDDFGFLRKLPDLEFLSLPGPADITPVNDLPKLRGLESEGWGGRLDFQRLPNLEWLTVLEAKRGLFDSLRSGHPRLHHVDVSRFPDADLSVFANLKHLVNLEVSYARQLSSLAGVEALARTLKSLAIANCPKLDSLAGLDKLSRATALSISECHKVTDFSPIAKMKALRHLALDIKRRPDLRALRGHQTLEVIELFGDGLCIDAAAVEMLQGLPGMRLLSAGKGYVKRRGRWEEYEDLRGSDLLMDSREAHCHF